MPWRGEVGRAYWGTVVWIAWLDGVRGLEPKLVTAFADNFTEGQLVPGIRPYIPFNPWHEALEPGDWQEIFWCSIGEEGG